LLLSGIALSASLALFVLLYRLVAGENLAGKRLVLNRFRSAIDHSLDSVSNKLEQAKKRKLASNRSQVVPTNNQSAATLLRYATRTPLTVRHTGNHLSQMSDHKSDTALTPAQKRKLSKKKLEERF